MIIGVINRHRVAANRRALADNYNTSAEDLAPVIRISNGRYGKPTYHNVYEFTNMSGRMVYDYKHPLPCGATCWIEFDNPSDIIKKEDDKV